MRVSTVVLRVVLVTTLVLVTYNPTGTSYFHFARALWPHMNGLFALTSVLLLMAWVVLVRTTFRALGLVGVTLLAALFGSLIWVGSDAGLFDLSNGTLRTWLVLSASCLILALGLSWADFRRWLSSERGGASTDSR